MKKLTILLCLIPLLLTGCNLLVAANIYNQQDKANIQLANTQLLQIKTGCQQYRLAYKKYPNSALDLVNPPDSRSIIDSEEGVKDPWGNYFEFEDTGISFTIYSSGPDGKPKTDDDIVTSF